MRAHEAELVQVSMGRVFALGRGNVSIPALTERLARCSKIDRRAADMSDFEAEFGSVVTLPWVTTPERVKLGWSASDREAWRRRKFGGTAHGYNLAWQIVPKLSIPRPNEWLPFRQQSGSAIPINTSKTANECVSRNRSARATGGVG
jgi:hypothetical protein